jgi:hypothetical protein
MSAVQIKGNAAGTGTLTIAAPNTNTNQTLTLPDNTGTLISTGSTFGGTGPAFSAYQNSNQTISAATWTKISCQTEEFDTASAFSAGTVVTNGDLTNRFTPQVAGYYSLVGMVSYTAVTATIYLAVYKNGSQNKTFFNALSNSAGLTGTVLIYLNGSTDYVELFAYVASGATVQSGLTSTYFQGFLARAA